MNINECIKDLTRLKKGIKTREEYIKRIKDKYNQIKIINFDNDYVESELRDGCTVVVRIYNDFGIVSDIYAVFKNDKDDIFEFWECEYDEFCPLYYVYVKNCLGEIKDCFTIRNIKEYIKGLDVENNMFFKYMKEIINVNNIKSEQELVLLLFSLIDI